MSDFLLIVGTTWQAARLHLQEVVRDMEGMVERVSLATGEAFFTGGDRARAIVGNSPEKIRGIEPTRIWVVGPIELHFSQEMRDWLDQQGDKVRYLY